MVQRSPSTAARFFWRPRLTIGLVMARFGFSTRVSSGRAPITSTSGSFTICARSTDLKLIFGRGGALEALVQARDEGRVRFLGLTGHHDPAILLEAMSRFDFDTVLIALNAADTHRLSFARTVLTEAARQGMGVIGMKVYAAGVLLRGGTSTVTSAEAMGYVLSLPGVSTVIIGCSSLAEVDENASNARAFQPFDESTMRALEEKTHSRAAVFTSYKRPA